MNLKSHLRVGALMLGLSLCGGLLTSAAHAAPGDGATKAGKAGKAGKGQRGGMRGGAMRMMKELNLTDAQKSKLKPIMESQRDEMKELREDTTLDRKAKMAKMKTLREATEKKIDAVLTADQRKKLVAIKAKMKAERKNGMGKRGGRSPQAPAA